MAGTETETPAFSISCSLILAMYEKVTGELMRGKALDSGCPESRASAGRDSLWHGHGILKMLCLYRQEEEAAGGEIRLSILFLPI